ncbi:MAG: hypothetical protein ABIP30_14415 [Ferruginibacter sp.]
MNIKSFLTNKYTLSLVILFACLFVDIILHKGMSRVIIPSSFTDKWTPQNITSCQNTLISSSKKWNKAIDNLTLIQNLPNDAAGFECDVYFDVRSNAFYVYHDSANISTLELDSLLSVYKKRDLTSSLWLDFKNLSAGNAQASLSKTIELRKKYNLTNKLIVESNNIKYLSSFCDSGFFTSYYTPYFNPYKIKEDDLVKDLALITENLKKYPVSALSGYYFQYPVLKRFFPNFPVLTWTDKSNISLISRYFNSHLENDDQIKVVLYPY